MVGVDVVEAHRLVADQSLAGTGLRDVHVLPLQHFGTAGLVETDGVRHGRVGDRWRGPLLSRKGAGAGSKKPFPVARGRAGRPADGYCVVLVVSVWVRVAEPAGVSTRSVVRVRDVSVVDGLLASMFTLVELLGAGCEGSTMVVEEVFGVGTSRTVSFSFTTSGFSTIVVEEEGVPDEGVVDVERSQPASVATANAAARGSITYLIEVSMLGTRDLMRHRAAAVDFRGCVAYVCFWRRTCLTARAARVTSASAAQDRAGRDARALRPLGGGDLLGLLALHLRD